jgi:hypothetical protein
MRSHIIAIAIAFAAGFGVNQFFFSPTIAKTNIDAVKSVGMDVSKIHVAEIPAQKMHDMSFVFSSND